MIPTSTSDPHFSPPAVIHQIKTEGRRLYIVRDDLLPAGTKQRACIPFLRDMNKKGFGKFIYASPFSGFAQVALAFSCQQLGYECHLFCEINKADSENKMHPFSQLAQFYGAQITLVDSLQIGEKLAEQSIQNSPDTMKIPLGFDCESSHALEETTEIKVA
ncbi:MAG: hypothetical protein A4S09_03520 [Proteobacteria bacterium SG_bin7]|nr:MAG: hypothetical protein A4S09_03520 [Proteobacteria bacterium SG_bin7]